MRPYGDPRRQYTGEYADPVPRQGSRTETPMESSIAAVSLTLSHAQFSLDQHMRESEGYNRQLLNPERATPRHFKLDIEKSRTQP